jgi:hypothetical protein
MNEHRRAAERGLLFRSKKDEETTGLTRVILTFDTEFE